jgi:hypothetical protein
MPYAVLGCEAVNAALILGKISAFVGCQYEGGLGGGQNTITHLNGRVTIVLP